MTQNATSAQGCIFCAIADLQAEASVVYEDETVVVLMDLNPVTPGHLLVVPRKHAVGLQDIDDATSAQVWSVGHKMARALRRSSLRCEGINVLLCDGEAAFSDGLPLPPPRHPSLRGRRLGHLSDGARTREAASRCRRPSDQERHRVDRLTDLPPTTYHLSRRRRSLRQVEADSGQGDAYPVGAVVELVAEFVDRLLD
jgi:hypothetical protein